jgi:putative glutamine amidotransferase
LSLEEGLPPDAAGLCVSGSGPFGESGEDAPLALQAALDGGIPVLCIDAGMQALNVTLGGGTPVPVSGHSANDGTPTRHGIFMALGSKLAETIGGAGTVMASGSHTHGVSRALQAPGTLASAYALDDGVLEAIEVPGPAWIIGVQWRAQALDEQPSGFDNLFHALVGISSER